MAGQLMRWLRWMVASAVLALPAAAWASADSRAAEADSLLLVGRAYYAEYRFIDALDVLGRAVALAEESGNAKAYMGSVGEIGNIHTLFDDYKMALHYYELCLARAQQLSDQGVETAALSNMLLCYAELGMADKAQQCYDLLGSRPVGDERVSRLYSYINQARLAKARKEYPAAIFLHKQAMEYAQTHEMNGHYIAAEMGKIGTLEDQIGNHAEALQWYLRCAEFSQQGNYLSPLVSAYEKLASLYREQGNDSASMRYQRLYVQLSDSLFLERDYNTKRSLIAEYESRRDTLKISSLSSQNDTLVLVISLISALLLLLVGLICYIVRQNRQLENSHRLIIEKHRDLTQQIEVQSRLNDEYLASVRDTQHDSLPPSAGDDDEAEASASADASAPLLSEQQTNLLLMSMVKVMEDTSIICDPDFCLQALAQRVGSNTKYVSWVINATYGKNFKTFLNEYRIREASRRLTDDEHYGHLTIAAIAEQLGYKSPTSFNQAFKRIFGMTPAAFQRLASK